VCVFPHIICSSRPAGADVRLLFSEYWEMGVEEFVYWVYERGAEAEEEGFGEEL
jgi:hypothetical protein